MPLLLLVFSFVLNVAGVSIFRRLTAGNSRLLDIPNERSSHSTPVTRGAGIAIVLTVLGLYSAIAGRDTDLSYVFAAGMIAVVSFLDDLFSVPLLIRLAVHFIAAGIFVYFSGSYLEISMPNSNLAAHFGSIAPWLTVLFVVWTINAFNFMDGIDGIAGAQGIGAGAGWMVFGMVTGVTSYSMFGAILFGSCAGFLVFNWQPARVFMGDVGSTFLGFTFAVFPLITAPGRSEPPPEALAATLVFLWLFLFDTIFTRLRLLARFIPFWRPHREHLYQRIVSRGASHRAAASYFGIVAIAAACAFSFAGTTGMVPLILILSISSVGLLVWAREKKIDVSSD